MSGRSPILWSRKKRNAIFKPRHRNEIFSIFVKDALESGHERLLSLSNGNHLSAISRLGPLKECNIYRVRFRCQMCLRLSAKKSDPPHRREKSAFDERSRARAPPLRRNSPPRPTTTTVTCDVRPLPSASIAEVSGRARAGGRTAQPRGSPVGRSAALRSGE